MITLQISQLARLQLSEIANYTRAKFGGEQAKQLARNFRKLFNQIASFPLTGSIDEEFPEHQLRRAILPPFIVLYSMQENRVMIVAILHGARNRAP